MLTYVQFVDKIKNGLQTCNYSIDDVLYYNIEFTKDVNGDGTSFDYSTLNQVYTKYLSEFDYEDGNRIIIHCRNNDNETMVSIYIK